MKRVLVLRTCDSDMKSYKGFQWPKSGYVFAPDWDPKPECGNGLHGLLRGEGEYSQLRYDYKEPINWVVCSVDPELIVDLDGKVKFPECKVVHVGDKESATNYIHKRLGYPSNFNPCIGGEAKAGSYCSATAGHYGYAVAGDFGQATAGEYGHAKAGYRGQATAGRYGRAESGRYGRSAADDRGTAAVGYRGFATAGYNGRAVAGDYGHASVQDGGTVMAGKGGKISVDYWHHDAEEYRLAVAYIGEGGLEADVPYMCRMGEWVRAGI